ncbi:PREDICTED: glycerol-3-phosphate transporter [Condylura cristata]|uniref:glycerol-3-phosphate transporter n=1 Tax=Condylura cristata TaxID=143302 RepID=UPI000642CEA4|nr:PREDICTED: glycerol-3-phosphate transporter [Condylura cristata]
MWPPARVAAARGLQLVWPRLVWPRLVGFGSWALAHVAPQLVWLRPVGSSSCGPGSCGPDPQDIACGPSPAAAKALENGTHRFRLQKQAAAGEKSQAQGPEAQCLLPSDGKRPAHQSHVVILPADGGMAAISFVGALKIPGVIEFSLCLLFAKLVSYTFLFWLPLYITSVDHLDAQRAGELSTLFDVGGIFGECCRWLTPWRETLSPT